MVPVPETIALALERLLRAEWSSRSERRLRRAVVLAIGLYGLRAEEVVHAENKDLCRRTGNLLVRSAKHGLFRRVTLHHDLVVAIGRLRIINAAMTESVWLVPTGTGKQINKSDVCGRFAAWCRRELGFAPFTFHSLRHTAAVRMYRETRDVVAVNKLLGHVHLQSTIIYLQIQVPAEPKALPQFSTPCDEVVRPKLYNPAGMTRPLFPWERDGRPATDDQVRDARQERQREKSKRFYRRHREDIAAARAAKKKGTA
jgi:integrase